MQKIGIFTFHFAHNYGAQLQAYALCRTLINLGFDCKIIDYRLRYIYRWKEVYNFKSFYYAQLEDGFNCIRSLLRTLRYYPKLIQKETPNMKMFESFIDVYMPKTPRIYTRNLKKIKFDTLICGSDQIWNIKLTGGFSNVYFLSMFDKCKKISYAASTGSEGFDIDNLDLIKKALLKFDSISCREKNLSKTVESLIKKQVYTVCDPVFLLKKEDWSELYTDNIIVKEKYILIYSFNEDDDSIIKTAEYFSKKQNLVIKKISIDFDNRLPEQANILNAGPREFLSLFNSAEIVLTNTFHGVATSIVLNKQFFVFLPQSGGERIENILDITNLKCRIIHDHYVDDSKKINYTLVNKILSNYRQSSIEYLKQSLL